VPRLQLELGVLYYRLGSYQLARNYLTAALQAPHVPPEVRARVEPYLADIRNRMAVDRFSGTITFGFHKAERCIDSKRALRPIR
jgi:hypothetical protein